MSMLLNMYMIPLIFIILKSSNAQRAPTLERTWDPNQGMVIRVTSQPPQNLVQYFVRVLRADNTIINEEGNRNGLFVISDCTANYARIFALLFGNGMTASSEEDLRNTELHHPPIPTISNNPTQNGIQIQVQRPPWPQALKIEYIAQHVGQPRPTARTQTTNNPFVLPGCGYQYIEVYFVNPCGQASQPRTVQLNQGVYPPPIPEYLPSEKVEDGIITRWRYMGDFYQITNVELHLYEGTTEILNQNFTTATTEYKIDQCAVTQMSIFTYNLCGKSSESAVQQIDLRAFNVAKCLSEPVIPVVTTPPGDGDKNLCQTSFLLTCAAILINSSIQTD